MTQHTHTQHTAGHTPAPWHIQTNLNGSFTIVGERHAGEHAPIIGGISGAALHDPRHIANLSLIAAAPELLAVAEAALNVSGKRTQEALKALARAAIAKAEGR